MSTRHCRREVWRSALAARQFVAVLFPHGFTPIAAVRPFFCLSALRPQRTHCQPPRHRDPCQVVDRYGAYPKREECHDMVDRATSEPDHASASARRTARRQCSERPQPDRKELSRTKINLCASSRLLLTDPRDECTPERDSALFLRTRLPPATKGPHERVAACIGFAGLGKKLPLRQLARSQETTNGPRTGPRTIRPVLAHGPQAP